MNLVVTGAASFLGRALIRLLLRQGHQVYAVVRPGFSGRESFRRDTAGAEAQQPAGNAAERGGLAVLELDMGQFDRLPELISVPCQVFFHFGWDGSGSENRKRAEIQKKNVTDSLKALEAAGRLGCRRFLFSGSQAEYGLCQRVMTEETACSPVSEYGKAKLEFGRRAMELAGAMEYIHTRIFSVYGPGDHPWSLVSTCLDRFQAGQDMELGACTQQWNYLYIDDLAEGLAALAFCEKKAAGIYNLAGGPDATRPLKDYVEEIHRLCGGRGRCLYGKVPPNAEGQAQLMPDITKISRLTGWTPKTGFEEGIRRMLSKNKERVCIVCGSRLPRKPLMTLEGMPASAQDIPDEGGLAADRGITLNLCQCGRCGLVQFDCEPVSYYRDVIRSGGYSTTMRELRTRQYRHLIDTYGLEGKKFLEVGCGRGEFLEMLTGFPVEAYGVEHRESLAELAGQAGLTVYRGFTETADTVLGKEGPYDVFLSFNFLEHQPEPGVMLDCIRGNLKDGGMGLITVPSLEYILKYDGYYELIRDHIAYYTFDTLRYLLERHGFCVLEEEMVNRDTLSVVVRKTGELSEESRREDPDGNPKTESPDGNLKTKPPGGNREGETERDASADIRPVDISGLEESYENIRQQVAELAEELRSRNQKLAVWGASHQGFTLAATTCLGECAAYMIDSAPFKQGWFAPASHVPIVAPDHFLEEPADVILIVAPGYTEEIRRIIRERFGEKVRIWALRSERMEELA